MRRTSLLGCAALLALGLTAVLVPAAPAPRKIALLVGVNVYDKRPDQTYATGAIVDVAKPVTPMKAGGKWNTLDITAQGSHLVVVLNGTKTVDVQDTKHGRGPIGLQYGAGVVKFRSVQIKAL